MQYAFIITPLSVRFFKMSFVRLLSIFCSCMVIMFMVANVNAKASTAKPASEKSDSINTNGTEMSGMVQVTNSWARATFALAKTGAAYFTIENKSSNTVVLKSATVSNEVASMVQIHHTVMQNDMMQMRELEEGVTIDPKQIIQFAPGGKHIMLMGLTGPLKPGASFAIDLQFLDGSHLSQTFTVKDKR